MGRKKSENVEETPDQPARLFAPSKAHDAALASLFASSSGPVEVPKRKARLLPENESLPTSNGNAIPDTKDSSSSDSDSSAASTSDVPETQTETERPRKRRRVEADDLEAAYFQRLAQEEERDELRRRPRRPQSPSEVLEDVSDANSEVAAVSEEISNIPVHEALVGENDGVDKSKVNRTVFLSNVSVDAIKSKSSRKELVNHLQGPLRTNHESTEKDKVESIRFRSTAYTGDSGPKKAGFATKNLMEQTTKSTNAYAVFSSQSAAVVAAKELNGTIILDRHLRIDHLANPSGIDHKRCVFVGNLNFVDQETTEDQAQDPAAKSPRPKARQPADAEEGLWRTFSKVAKVENVRVVRDKHTRVGKGFAYVQFADQNGVEAALLLNDKKFPPLLPRKLRVQRAKKSRDKPSKATKENSSSGFKSGPLRKAVGSRVGGARNDRRASDSTPNKMVFEGHRASKSSSKDNKQKKRRPTKTPNRSAKRGAAFKASGGKKQRDRNP